jgi:hypothetical protein
VPLLALVNTLLGGGGGGARTHRRAQVSAWYVLDARMGQVYSARYALDTRPVAHY